MAYEATPFDPYTVGSLEKAKALADNYQPTASPAFVGSTTKSPTQTPFYEYAANQSYNQVQAPNYKVGLMNGDYDALQKSLQTPGDISAQNAFNKGWTNLRNTMGANGIYGSSIMAKDANEGVNREFMNTLTMNAANAATERYKLQQQAAQDENAFGANVYGTQVSDALNKYKAGFTDSTRQTEYNAAKYAGDASYADKIREWENSQAYEKYLYDVAQQKQGTADTDSAINRYLSIAGQGAPLSQSFTSAQSAYDNYLAQMAKTKQSQDSANMAGIMGAIGTVGGGLMSGYKDWSSYEGNNGLLGYAKSFFE